MAAKTPIVNPVIKGKNPGPGFRKFPKGSCREKIQIKTAEHSQKRLLPVSLLMMASYPISPEGLGEGLPARVHLLLDQILDGTREKDVMAAQIGTVFLRRKIKNFGSDLFIPIHKEKFFIFEHHLGG